MQVRSGRDPLEQRGTCHPRVFLRLPGRDPEEGESTIDQEGGEAVHQRCRLGMELSDSGGGTAPAL
jgi:hypothetical protein